MNVFKALTTLFHGLSLFIDAMRIFEKFLLQRIFIRNEGESDVFESQGNCFSVFFHQGPRRKERKERTFCSNPGKVKEVFPMQIFLHPNFLSEWRTARFLP